MAGRERSISALRACHSRELLAGASQPRQRLLVASGHDRDAEAGMFRTRALTRIPTRTPTST